MLDHDRVRRAINQQPHHVRAGPIYEIEGLERLLDALGPETVPVLATVRPLTGFDEAEFLLHEVPDVRIPARTIATLRDAGDGAAQVGLELRGPPAAAAGERA